MRADPSAPKTGKLTRAVIGLLAIVFAAVAGCTSPAAIHPKPAIHDRSRPNIVFVLTDDVSWNLVSTCRTCRPCSRRGRRSRYFVVDSLCCPSRSSIFTGEYPHDDGVFTNGGADGGYPAFNRNGDAINSFALALHDAGYRTALLGKYLNEYLPDDPGRAAGTSGTSAGYAYREFDYDLNQNGKVQHYGKAPQDYLTDVLAAKARSSSTPRRLGQAVHARGRDVRRALSVHARAPLRARLPERSPPRTRPMIGCPPTRRLG